MACHSKEKSNGLQQHKLTEAGAAKTMAQTIQQPGHAGLYPIDAVQQAAEVILAVQPVRQCLLKELFATSDAVTV